MSTKNFVSYGDAETIFTKIANAIKGKKDEYETITYEQWQRLTPAQRAVKDYYISDYPASAITAGNVSYDNTESGMAANEVQGAIDELKSGLEGRFGNQTYVRLGHGVGDNENPITVELSETYMNYDMVCFLISYYDNGVACYGYVAIPSTIFKYFLSTDAGTPMYYHYNNNNTGCVRIRKVDDTHISFDPQGFSIGGNRCVVYGVKLNAEVMN